MIRCRSDMWGATGANNSEAPAERGLRRRRTRESNPRAGAHHRITAGQRHIFSIGPSGQLQQTRRSRGVRKLVSSSARHAVWAAAATPGRYAAMWGTFNRWLASRRGRRGLGGGGPPRRGSSGLGRSLSVHRRRQARSGRSGTLAPTAVVELWVACEVEYPGRGAQGRHGRGDRDD